MLVLGWTFLEFVSADGKAPFSIWLSEQPVEAQAAIDNRILMMMNLARPQWSPKWIKSYKGHEKLFELRIPHNKVQYRPLGCYGPDKQEFTIVAGAIEKNWKLPRPVLEVAMKRIELVGTDRRWVREYQFDS
jgi:hypothetical protein